MTDAQRGNLAPTIEAAVPVFRVANIARSITWYADVLGFAADPFGPPSDPSFAILRRDGVELMLQKASGGVGRPPATAEAGGGWDAYIRVSDAHTFRDGVRMKAPGTSPVERRVYGCLEFVVTDPDGHVLVFGQRT
jgi:catechol 2,3-dioxygenase-like lactoylglutathione lyase family enzyme